MERKKIQPMNIETENKEEVKNMEFSQTGIAEQKQNGQKNERQINETVSFKVFNFQHPQIQINKQGATQIY